MAAGDRSSMGIAARDDDGLGEQEAGGHPRQGGHEANEQGTYILATHNLDFISSHPFSRRDRDPRPVGLDHQRACRIIHQVRRCRRRQNEGDSICSQLQPLNLGKIY